MKKLVFKYIPTKSSPGDMYNSDEKHFQTKNFEYIITFSIQENISNNKLHARIAKLKNYINDNSGAKSKVQPMNVFKAAKGWFPKVQGYNIRFARDEDKGKYNIFYSETARNEFINQGTEGLYGKKIVAFNENGDPEQEFDNTYKAIRWLQYNSKNDTKVFDSRSIVFLAKKNGTAHYSNSYGYDWRFAEHVLID